jgi:hypothetical protein
MTVLFFSFVFFNYFFLLDRIIQLQLKIQYNL